MNKEQVNILGTKYKIIFKSDKDEVRLKENWDFTDYPLENREELLNILKGGKDE